MCMNDVYLFPGARLTLTLTTCNVGAKMDDEVGWHQALRGAGVGS